MNRFVKVMRRRRILVALFAASVLTTAPAQAKFIGIAIYDPIVMLPICKKEIAEGRAGVCTGYVIAISEEMRAHADGHCLPPGVEYEDMVQAVVSGTELYLQRPPGVVEDFMFLTERALRNTWPCK